MAAVAELKTCILCKRTSSNTEPDTLLFGDWMIHRNITVHYFCLLLSTHLPQKGCDTSGILGFFVHDIRIEEKAAAERKCVYCNEMHATVQCDKCEKQYHLYCGRVNECLFQFCEQFKSHCADCRPLNKQQQEDVKHFNEKGYGNVLCVICSRSVGEYRHNRIFKSMCCDGDYLHTICLQKYAIERGYYLRCLFCGNSDFRDEVRKQGIFVPDRDAIIEKERQFQHLHKKTQNCDVKTCHCPRGRNYSSPFWNLIRCDLCGSEAHNPVCALNNPNAKEKLTEYTCEVCAKIEQKRRDESMNITVNSSSSASTSKQSLDTSVYVNKLTSKPRVMRLYTFNESETTMECTGQVKVRIDPNDPRFVVKNGSKIIPKSQLKEEEIIEVTNDIGIFAKINEIIDRFK